MEYYTFEQLKEMAFKDGITGNKVAVGIWAKMNGFLKKKKQINKRRITFYFKLDDWQPQNAYSGIHIASQITQGSKLQMFFKDSLSEVVLRKNEP